MVGPLLASPSPTKATRFVVDISSDEEEDNTGIETETLQPIKEASLDNLESPISKKNTTLTIAHTNSENPGSSKRNHEGILETKRRQVTEDMKREGQRNSIASTDVSSDQDYLSAVSEMGSNEQESFVSLSNLIASNTESAEKVEDTSLSRQASVTTLTLIQRRSSIPMLKDFYYEPNADDDSNPLKYKDSLRRKSNSEMIYKLLKNKNSSTSILENNTAPELNFAGAEIFSEDENSNSIVPSLQNSAKVLPYNSVSNSGSLRRRASQLSTRIRRNGSIEKQNNFIQTDTLTDGERNGFGELALIKSQQSSLKRSNATRRKMGWLSQVKLLFRDLKLKTSKKWRSLITKKRLIFKKSKSIKRSKSTKKIKNKKIKISPPELVRRSNSLTIDNFNRKVITYQVPQISDDELKALKLPKISEEGEDDLSIPLTNTFNERVKSLTDNYNSADVKYEKMDQYLEAENSKVIERVDIKERIASHSHSHCQGDKTNSENSSDDETLLIKHKFEESTDSDFMSLWSHYFKTVVRNRIAMRLEIDEITVPKRTRYSYLLDNADPNVNKIIMENEINNGNQFFTRNELAEFTQPRMSHTAVNPKRESLLKTIISESEDNSDTNSQSSLASSVYSDQESDDTSLSSHEQDQYMTSVEQPQQPEFEFPTTPKDANFAAVNNMEMGSSELGSKKVVITKNFHLKYVQDSFLEKRESIFSVNPENFPLVIGSRSYQESDTDSASTREEDAFSPSMASMLESKSTISPVERKATVYDKSVRSSNNNTPSAGMASLRSSNNNTPRKLSNIELGIKRVNTLSSVTSNKEYDSNYIMSLNSKGPSNRLLKELERYSGQSSFTE